MSIGVVEMKRNLCVGVIVATFFTALFGVFLADPKRTFAGPPPPSCPGQIGKC